MGLDSKGSGVQAYRRGVLMCFMTDAKVLHGSYEVDVWMDNDDP